MSAFTKENPGEDHRIRLCHGATGTDIWASLEHRQEAQEDSPWKWGFNDTMVSSQRPRIYMLRGPEHGGGDLCTLIFLF